MNRTITIVKLTKEGYKTSNAISDINNQLDLGLTQEQINSTSLEELGFTGGYYNAMTHSLELYQ